MQYSCYFVSFFFLVYDGYNIASAADHLSFHQGPRMILFYDVMDDGLI